VRLTVSGGECKQADGSLSCLHRVQTVQQPVRVRTCQPSAVLYQRLLTTPLLRPFAACRCPLPPLQFFNTLFWQCSIGVCVDKSVDDVGFVEKVMQDIPNRFAVNKGQVSTAVCNTRTWRRGKGQGGELRSVVGSCVGVSSHRRLLLAEQVSTVLH
jgi:hypothetical protein